MRELVSLSNFQCALTVSTTRTTWSWTGTLHVHNLIPLVCRTDSLTDANGGTPHRLLFAIHPLDVHCIWLLYYL